MALILYPDKDEELPEDNPARLVTDDNMNEIKNVVNTNATTVLSPVSSAIASAVGAHSSLTNNPHSVTKAQVGLSNVDNTSDVNKPVSTAQAAAIAAAITALLLRMVYSEPLTGTIDGVNDTFTIAFPAVAGTVRIYNSIRNTAGGEDYTITGQTIVFMTPPDLGSNLLADYIKS